MPGPILDKVLVATTDLTLLRGIEMNFSSGSTKHTGMAYRIETYDVALAPSTSGRDSPAAPTAGDTVAGEGEAAGVGEEPGTGVTEAADCSIPYHTQCCEYDV